MRVLVKCKTITAAMNSNTPTLSRLVRELGIKPIEAYIKLWLVDLDKTLMLKNSFKPHQIDAIAFRVVSEYKNLNIADINLIFTNAKFGEFGEFYDRLTVPAVIKWFRLYFDQRCEAAALQSQNLHISNKPRHSGNHKPLPKVIQKARSVFGGARLHSYENKEAIEKIKKQK